MPETGSANIGVVGLAVMGSNLARNLASREGNTVAVFNRSPGRTHTLISEHPTAEAAFAEIDRLSAQMVRTGASSDAVELIVVDDAGEPMRRPGVH